MIRKSLYPAIVLAAAGIVLAWAYISPAAPPEGKGYDRPLEKITFIHYKKDYTRPPGVGGGKDKNDEGYYTFIANGFRWKSLGSPYVFSLAGTNLTESFVHNSMVAGMNEWEEYSGYDIFGGLTRDDSKVAGVQDEINTFSFGDYPQNGVIAVTTVWGYFSGPPSSREILEADILFDTDFSWGDVDTDGFDVMDFLNIATHELGHCAGMGDLYRSGAADETMYGYSTEGETKKRDLYTGDIAGISKLY